MKRAESNSEENKLKERNEKIVSNIERLFKKVANINEKKNISSFPIRANIDNVALNKEKAKEFSEVFTPLWLVDQMISQVEFDRYNMITLDLCAGYGQFTVRLMRYLHNTFPFWDVRNFLKNTHAFSELQLSSCYKLLRIFSDQITLFIGDSTHLGKLPEDAKGLWCYIEDYGYWVCLTKTIQNILCPTGDKKSPVSEEAFVGSMETLIHNLNEVYVKSKEDLGLLFKEMYNVTLQQVNSPGFRLELIKTTGNAIGEECVQYVYTPPEPIHDMLECIEYIERKSILVLFNGEIIEYLIHKKVAPENIVFGVDGQGSDKAALIKKMYGIDTVLVGNDNNGKFKILTSAFKGRKFDVRLSDLPYNRGLDLKILRNLMNASICKEYVIVHPSTWLLDQKNKTDIYGDIKRLITNKLKSVKFFDGNATFDAQLFVPCIITHIDTVRDSPKTNVDFFGDEFEVDSIYDLTKWGREWLTLVKPFVLTIEKFIQKNGQVWAHNTRTVEQGKFYCQAAAIRGHVRNCNKTKNAKNASKETTTDDFYTMLIDVPSCKGIRQRNLNRPGNPTPTFGFDTEIERDNFLHYLNTDFARFCLAILKNNGNLAVGEMELIPWLDFKQSWDDEKLFKYFDIIQETQDYIRQKLPDYYGIRKNNANFQAQTIQLPRQPPDTGLQSTV